jgi:signal transduction histidine kinase
MTFWPGNYTLEALMKNAPFTDAFGCGLVSAAACGRFAASGGYFPLLSAGLPPPVVDLQSCQASLIQMQAARDLFPRSPERATRNLDDPIDMASGAIVEGRGAIQELRSQPAVQDDLAKVLTMTGQDLRCRELKEGSVTFRVDVEGEQQLLKPLLQDEVSRIARELLRNAFRHSQASQIEAEIRYEPHLLRLHVRDDGKGIEPEILKTGGRDGHWGLAGVRERAKRIGARLDFWSEAGSGTEVQLTVPASIAYQTNHKESRSWLPWRRGCVRDP